MESIVTEEYKNTIPPEKWEEWNEVTKPYKDSIRRWEEAQARKEARKKGIKPEPKAVETYEQVIRNNTIDEFIENLRQYFEDDSWVCVMAKEIAEQMKGGAT
jgi:DNA polymerase elongation subunit (family B)